MQSNDLFEPGSRELEELVSSSIGRQIYEVLFRSISTPLTLSDIRLALHLEAGEQEELSRRLRDLDTLFLINRIRSGTDTRYQLVGRKTSVDPARGSINKTLRAKILRNQRCAQCGRTPSEDLVKLHVDHKIPQTWGGNDEEENLQALCSECNEGKKDYFATYDQYADFIRKASRFAEPHQRIGELLKAFEGKPVPADLIELVARSQQHQTDWRRRLRELRELGWQYVARKKWEGKKVVTYVTLLRSEDWPTGSISGEIKRRSAERKVLKKEDEIPA